MFPFSSIKRHVVGGGTQPGGVTDGRTFYVSSQGDDVIFDGRSPRTPWRTLTKVNTVAFKAGDAILFRGGHVFTGTLTILGPNSLGAPVSTSGTAENPIVVSSYGGCRATIDALTGYGLDLQDVGGIEIIELNVTTSTPATNDGVGISYFNGIANTNLDHFLVDGSEVSNFNSPIVGGHTTYYTNGWGIIAGYSSDPTSTFTNVTVINVDAHHNLMGGVLTSAVDLTGSGGTAYPIVTGCYFGGIWAHDNPGGSGITNHSGSGILMSGVTNGLIDRCVANDNGKLSTYNGGGPYGIWAAVCDHVTIQRCESFGNYTLGTYDGGGFDLDVGVFNSVVQYCYSHDNGGPGFALVGGTGYHVTQNNVIRYNVSENDGLRATTGGVHVAVLGASTYVDGNDIVNNTVYVGAVTKTSTRGIYVANPTRNLRIRNNLVVTVGNRYLLYVPGTQVTPLVQNNNWYPSGGTFNVYWQGTPYTSLAAFQATGQEKIGGVAVGYSVDPLLTAPGLGFGIGDPDRLPTLEAYKLKTGSPMIGAGRNLFTEFGTPVGSYDFYGNALPQGSAFDVGAHER